MVSVSVDEAPEFTEVGANAPDTPAGAPLSESATLCAPPVVTAVLIVVWVWVPCTALTDDGDAPIEKSFVASPTTGCEIRHELLSFENVACIANDPVAKLTFWAPPVPPNPFQAHLSAFS